MTYEHLVKCSDVGSQLTGFQTQAIPVFTPQLQIIKDVWLVFIAPTQGWIDSQADENWVADYPLTRWCSG